MFVHFKVLPFIPLFLIQEVAFFKKKLVSGYLKKNNLLCKKVEQLIVKKKIPSPIPGYQMAHA